MTAQLVQASACNRRDLTAQEFGTGTVAQLSVLLVYTIPATVCATHPDIVIFELL